ncbi:hypothetical protein FCM35_KLT13035 [Carex littledalei]|uniref:Uncharacterized protein n=1 Tax=Carex littledalei TaxID=544730 RepID=A0A833QNZ6_9POAL|nr:hypothetical protein FCM35_KLT13035 [Carex littledalei]
MEGIKRKIEEKLHKGGDNGEVKYREVKESPLEKIKAKMNKGKEEEESSSPIDKIKEKINTIKEGHQKGEQKEKGGKD